MSIPLFDNDQLYLGRLNGISSIRRAEPVIRTLEAVLNLIPGLCVCRQVPGKLGLVGVNLILGPASLVIAVLTRRRSFDRHWTGTNWTVFHSGFVCHV